MIGHGLHILVYPQPGGFWVARALEHDITAEARSVESAVDTVLRIIRAHIAFDRRHNREPMSAFAAAPSRFRDAFASGTRLPYPVGLDSIDDVTLRTVVAMVPHYPGPTAARQARTA